MRLIDADALLETLNKEKIQFRANVNYFIMHAPTVDAEPVVRCKDCKWWGDRGCAVITYDESDIPNDDDFCSWGERREDEVKQDD